MYVCMYVCPKIYIRRALSRKVTVAPRSQTNRNDFSVRLNRSVDKSAERREEARLFQILAPATAILRSPNVLLVRRTTNIAVSDDRSVRRPESVMSWQSSARYGGSWPSSDLWINSASLNSARCRTGSQWSRRSTGVICSRRPVPVTRRAAAFWMPCNRWNRSLVMPRAVSCSSPIGTTQTPAPVSWRRSPTVTWWLAATASADNSSSDRVRWRGPTDWGIHLPITALMRGPPLLRGRNWTNNLLHFWNGARQHTGSRRWAFHCIYNWYRKQSFVLSLLQYM